MLYFYLYDIRVPVFEERIDNIVGIAYAMDMLEYVEKVGVKIYFINCCVTNELNFQLIHCFKYFSLLLKVDKLQESTVKEIAHKPTYFVPGNTKLVQ